MSEETKISAFGVFARMIDADDQAIKVAPLSNIISAQAGKKGTTITMGVGGNVVGQILHDEFVGGLLLCDRKRFNEVKAEMEAERGIAK